MRPRALTLTRTRTLTLALTPTLTATRKQARIDAGTDVIVGVSKYTSGRAQPQPELRVIDNTKVRAAQVARLAQLRASRDGEEVARCLRQLTAAAASYEQP